MSNPRTKRLFAGAAADPAQRNITSFFHKASTSTSPSAVETELEARVLSPTPPADVQANLLSVGMRVRKSVPEGYKVGSAYSSFALWSDSPAPQRPHQQQLQFNVSRPADLAMYTSSASGGKELLPFCGIHKVGGLAAQPETSHAPLFRASVFNSAGTDSTDDQCPGLTSSQDTVGSTLSTASSASTNRKRRAVGEDEEDVPEETRPQQQAWALGWCDGAASLKTVVPASGHGGRAMAVPRRRGARKTGVVVGGVGGQENKEVEVVGDFGEAPFLDWGEMEIEMADG